MSVKNAESYDFPSPCYKCAALFPEGVKLGLDVPWDVVVSSWW